MISVVHLNFFKSIPLGVVRQLEMELSAIESLKLDWHLIVFSNDSNSKEWHTQVKYTGLFAYFYGRFLFFSEVLSQSRSNRIVLLRYSIADPVQALFSPWFRNVVSIHHTLEIEESQLAGKTKGKVKSWLERFVGRIVLKRVSGIIGVTEEIANYEKQRANRNVPIFVAPNGIDMKSVVIASDKRAGIPKLLFVASIFAPWHGLDLLLHNIQKSTKDFSLLVVGNVPLELLSLLSKDPRITYLGILDAIQIAGLNGKCDVGISSLALGRKGMKEACTLKVREYLASGLACYADHRDSGLPPDFPFFHQGGADIDKICQYALDMRKVSRNEIRNTAFPFIDKQVIVKKIDNWLDSLS